MKWVILLFVPTVALSCPKGTEPYKDTCLVELQPEVALPIKPSDERPPEDKMPSYQRDGIVTIDEPNMATEDAKADEEKQTADIQGKNTAGIKP